MTGIKSFILGFSLSLFSVTLGGQLYYPSAPKKKTPKQVTEINLFKSADMVVSPLSSEKLFAEVKKLSYITEQPSVVEDEAIDTAQDDEILNINLDDTIPIEYGSPLTDGNGNAEILYNDNDEKTAMLPEEAINNDDSSYQDTPWVTAKTSITSNNHALQDGLANSHNNVVYSERFPDNREISYKVAEKIKQSIIFPIPNEILNDENLTPTFINRQTNAPVLTPSKPKATKPQVVIPQKTIDNTTNSNKKGLMDSISSWFSDNAPKSGAASATKTSVKKRPAPSYSSYTSESNNSENYIQSISTGIDNTSNQNVQSNNDLVNFYTSLQKTKQHHQAQAIMPTELKLSFQPNRAEISGSTLDWLKMFSEAAMENNTYLRVRIDGNIDEELQKRRLYLLYTIFMNNGVDLQKVDTVFTLSEPNAFIIQMMKF